MKNSSIEKILQTIEERSEYYFLYNSKLIDVDRKMDIQAKEESIASVLNRVFGAENVEYEVKGTQIILHPKEMNRIASELIANVQQQRKQITGKITDEQGAPIIGANVIEKGTTNGTVTDIDGNFSFRVEEGSVLEVSYIGYLEQEISTVGRTSVNIILYEDTKTLDEVIVIGYGTAKRKDLTGAVSRINTDDLAGQAPRNVHDILRANAAGLNIGIASDAKADASMSIRGQGTLSAGSAPLIVLDGVIYEGALTDINPEDIATVDILKDASSAAVYGAKAANGVIAFTTKRGKTGKPIIDVNTNIAFVQSASQPKILDSEGFLRFRQDYNIGRNSDEYLQRYPQIFINPFELEGINRLDWYNYDQATPVTEVNDDQLTTKWLSRLNLTTPEIENYFSGKITKWDDLVFQTGLQQSYTVSVSNTTDHTSQYISLNWSDREGVVVGDRYQVFRVRSNVESVVTPFLTVGINGQYAFRNESFMANSWTQMTMISPYGSNNMDDPDSPYRRRPTGMDPINPFYDNFYRDRKSNMNNINAKLYALVTLPFDIKYTFNFTPYFHNHDYYNHNSSEGDLWVSIGGQSTRSHVRRFNWQIDNIVQWEKEFANIHKVEMTLLANAEKAQYWSTTANAQEYAPSDVLGYHRLQAGAKQTNSSDDSYQTGDALMARLFYSLKNKYMLTTSVRRDGYSAFGKKNPRATFPAIALGWTFSEENFMELSNDWLSYGKLRFSWGENGNRDIGQYAALSRMSSSLHPYIDQSGNIYSISQIYVNSMSNYNLKWERTASYNLGVDFALFNDLISGSIEGYISRTNDLLVNRALPDITSFTNVTSNLGQLQNKGVELTLHANIIRTKDLSWSISGNFSMNRRKINKLYGDMVDILDDNGNVIGQREADDETNGWFIGQDPDRIWAYERDGVWQLDEAETAEIYGCQPGDFKYIDQNGDKIMDNKDKTFQGYRTPRYRWTLKSDLKYKNFTFSTTFYSYGNYYGAFQRAANNYSFPDRTSDYDFPRWTSTNPINDYARIGSKNIGTNWVNRTFIRLENVSLSYNFPKALTQPFSIQGLRLVCSIQNAAVWAHHWNFWDPESTSVTPRTFNMGVNITL